MSRSAPLSGVLPYCRPSIGGFVISTLFVQLLSTNERIDETLLALGGDDQKLSICIGTSTLAPWRVAALAMLSIGPHAPHAPVVLISAWKQFTSHEGFGTLLVLP